MIQKVTRREEIPVVGIRDSRAALRDRAACRRFNLIYGWNGCG